MVFVCVHCQVVCEKQVKLIVLHVCTSCASYTCACIPVRKTMIADVSRMPQRRRGSKVVTGFGGGFRSKRLEEEQSSSSKWSPRTCICQEWSLYHTSMSWGCHVMVLHALSCHDLCTHRSTEETDDENGKANVSDCNYYVCTDLVCMISSLIMCMNVVGVVSVLWCT